MKVVFALPGRQFSAKFLESLLSTIAFCESVGIKWAVSLGYCCNIYRVRNIVLNGKYTEKTQVPLNGFEYDKIVWIDSDIVFTPSQFNKLISHDLDIVSGLYVTEEGYYACGKFNSEAEMIETGADVRCYNKGELPENALVEVEWTGFGFLSVKRGVFERLEYPWFRPILYKINGDYEDFYTEDVAICKRLRDLGYKIYVDTSIKVGHEKLKVLR